MKSLKQPAVIAAFITGGFALAAAFIMKPDPPAPNPEPTPAPPYLTEKKVRFNLVKITVNYDCDSGRNGGDFEGDIVLRLPDNKEELLTTLDVVDGQGHDTNAGVQEGQSKVLNKTVEFALKPGESFNLYGTRIIEATGNDHEFDDNPVRLNETYTYSDVHSGPFQKVLDDGDNCMLTFDWAIQVTDS